MEIQMNEQTLKLQHFKEREYVIYKKQQHYTHTNWLLAGPKSAKWFSGLLPTVALQIEGIISYYLIRWC